MGNDATTGRRGVLLRLAAGFCLFLAVSCGVRGEEAAARTERLLGLVESLDTGSERRVKVLDIIYGELRGADSREMHAMVREALSRKNSLILQGAVRALAMLADPADIDVLDAFLSTTPSLEAKTLTLRLLPAFCLSGSERARFNYIRYADGMDRVADPTVLASVRRPPLTRRGQFNPVQDRIRLRVTRMLAGQFDPIGRALDFLSDPVYGQQARATVTYYVGTSLGPDPGRWKSIWRDLPDSAGSIVRVPDEVEEIRLSALASLSDMGAEGLPEILGGFEELLRDGDEMLAQALFETMTSMCRAAIGEAAAVSAATFEGDGARDLEAWRARTFAAVARLIVFAAGEAGQKMQGNTDASAFGAAAACMGAAFSFPSGFPDADGGLAAARASGLAFLERTLMAPDIGAGRRAAIVGALGDIGAARSVMAIASVLGSPYASPESGAEGMRLAEAAVASLSTIAAGGQEGRNAARGELIALLSDARSFPSGRAGVPPVGLQHMALWRLQRLARSTDTSLEKDFWLQRLGW